MNLIADHNKLNGDSIALLLIESLKECNFEDSFIYYNFPFYRGETSDDLVQAHVLFISKVYGVIFFRCINSFSLITEPEKKRLDDLDSHIFARINKLDELRIGRRDLKINVLPLIFINEENIEQYNDTEIINKSKLKSRIIENKKEVLIDTEFESLLSCIEGTVNLRKKKDREIQTSEFTTKGRVLNEIQNLHSVFDIEQKRAALNTIDSPQRIRGLAGSGKTIILTMKAALYHLQNPDSQILYTYFTKALYGQIKYLIEKYYRDFSDNREPNWNKIDILHGWGGKGLRGVYSDTCSENLIEPISFLTARSKNPNKPFSYICEQLNKNQLQEKYDLTLIDEGQDFPIHFYRVCRQITKNTRIVWAYDDFQNIFDVNIQDEKETFGKNSDGNYYVDFSRDDNQLQDIVLYKCYRNSRITLLNAFSLGLGIYNDRVLQRLEDNSHWENLGFAVETGDSSDNSEMVISRPEKNSPLASNRFFDETSVVIEIFNDIQTEVTFIVQKIIDDIKKEELRPDDICVISLDSRNTKMYFSLIEASLEKHGIKSFNLLNASNNNTYFNINGYVTLSTLNKAKGNETGMVYIVGVDSVFKNKDYIIDRNKLFTAITRSKGWVVMSGYTRANICKEEMKKLKENGYKLVFKQPTHKDTKTILRGMTKRHDLLNVFSDQISKLKATGLSTDDILKLIEETSKPSK